MRINLKPLSEQVVVVVGASSGIGRVTALSFGQRGAKVVAAARSKDGLDSLVNQIVQSGGQAAAVVADVTDFQQVKVIGEQAVLQFGRIDTWVHLAAVSVYARFDQMEPEEFKRVIEVNLIGQAYGAMVALPHLKQAGQGALIHVTSVEARLPLPLHAAYTASKHGLQGFIDALRMEVKEDGIPISVTNVLPASINTPLFEHARSHLGVKPRPMPPVYQPKVVADAILYAAEHPVEEIMAGGAPAMLMATQKLSRPLARRITRRLGMATQRTHQPELPGGEDNLFAPMPGTYSVQGSFGKESRGFSLYTWLNTHPAARTALAGSLLSGLTFVALQSRRKGKI